MAFSTTEECVRRAETAVEWEEECWILHPVFDGGDLRRIKRTTNHIVHETQEARQWSNFPTGAIAVASDGGGNFSPASVTWR